MKQKTPLTELKEWVDSKAIFYEFTRSDIINKLTELLPKEKEVITNAFIAGDKTDCFIEQNIYEFATDYFNETFTQK
jgi:hypothetical protein